MPRRVRPAGSRALLVPCTSWREAQRLARELRERPLDGQADVVQGEASVLVQLADAESARAAEAQLRDWTPGPPADSQARQVRIEVTYDGPDLDEAGELTGLGRAGLVHLHAQTEWTVAFVGFAPGFAYLVAPHDRLRVPRRTEPRKRVRAGSVALGGAYAAVYPRESPGGWQLIGRSPTVMWDVRRDPPATLAAGDRVRFAPVREAITLAQPAGGPASRTAPPEASADQAPQGPGLVVDQPGFLATVQDRGRPGLGHLGIGRSGALDPGALATANWLAGNPPGAAGIEVAPGGFRVQATGDLVLAVTGARADLTISEAGFGPAPRPAPFATPFLLRAGQLLSFGSPRAGIRCYLAVRGGVAVAPVLGSRSTDTLAALGPPPLRAGTFVPVGPEPDGEVGYGDGPGCLSPASAATAGPSQGQPEPAVLALTFGPGDDQFPAEALDRLLTSTWTVSPAADRVGLRLSGSDGPLPVRNAAELPSEGIVTGSIQVPPSGNPILFLNDHPVTGGYPVIGVIEAAALAAAAQLAPGDRVVFALADRAGEDGDSRAGVPAA